MCSKGSFTIAGKEISTEVWGSDRILEGTNRFKVKGSCQRDKLAIVIGERDGVQAPSIGKCLKSVGGMVVYPVIECFV